MEVSHKTRVTIVTIAIQGRRHTRTYLDAYYAYLAPFAAMLPRLMKMNLQ